MRQIAKSRDKARVQRDAARLAILSPWETDMPAREIDITPIEPQGFANPRSGQKQKFDKGPQVWTAGSDKPFGFLDREPALAAGPQTSATASRLRTLSADRSSIPSGVCG
jgi:hypothetical protein